MSRQSINLPLGLLNGTPLKLSFKGYVLCEGEGERDLYDAFIMTLTKAGVEKKIIVEVFVTVMAEGTAALLDDWGNVWLYSPAETGIILPIGGKDGFESLIMADEVFDADVSVHDDSDAEMETNSEKLYLDSV